MKNLSIVRVISSNFLAVVFVLFNLQLVSGQTELYKPKANNRSIQKVKLLLPGSSKAQEVEVEKVDGAYILEGDMMVYPHEHTAAGISRDKRWPKGIIPFQIEGGHPFVSNIHAAVEEINRLTNLRLVPRTNQNNYVKIKYDPDGGCWSNIGRRAFSVNKISLGDGCNSKGIIIHELMHTAGLFHEQSRTDRDHHIRINRSNIKNMRERWDYVHCFYYRTSTCTFYWERGADRV